MTFEKNTLGLGKITIDVEVLWPRERAANLRSAV
jgi:hypothetical protein